MNKTSDNKVTDEKRKKLLDRRVNDCKSGSSAILLEEILRVEKEMNQCKTNVGEALEAGTIRMDEIGDQVDLVVGRVSEVAASVEKLRESIGTLIEIFEAGEKFFKVIGWIGKGVKWTAMVGGSIALIWYFLKTGTWHK